MRILILLVMAMALKAQPTMAMFQRVMMIESHYGRGTAFSIDVDGCEYWVTAKHILTGAKSKPYGNVAEKTLDLKLLNPGGDGEQWLTTRFTILQPATDVDIVVLVPPAIIANSKSPPPSSDGLTLGGNCEFMGFAYGGGWKAKIGDGSFWLPYIKRCTVSGMDMATHMWILDGINNVGFSGGPVILGTGNDLKIVAVISGYMTEPTDVIRGDKTKEAPKDTVNVNSGFILAYDILHAVDAIKKNPIGPVRPPAK